MTNINKILAKEELSVVYLGSHSNQNEGVGITLVFDIGTNGTGEKTVVNFGFAIKSINDRYILRRGKRIAYRRYKENPLTVEIETPLLSFLAYNGMAEDFVVVNMLSRFQKYILDNDIIMGKTIQQISNLVLTTVEFKLKMFRMVVDELHETQQMQTITQRDNGKGIVWN